MSQPPPQAFELSKASVTADGLLTLSGTVRAVSGQADGGYSFVLAVRGGAAEREYPARTEAGAPGAVRVSCSVPLAELAAAPEDFVDLYFQARDASGSSRTRVTWQPSSLRWLPYPTKFGNLSLKRKAQ
ncbi:hypothetical protein [Arthrobacter mobilis]|uniref:Uncharacterized protein n=1 Tax=Arthrobacter mobilis TaxID=2724944 RepID=A0A7X6K7B4_9MICC|nr:hypothetical protein [Arthrobacter mobilis]NKX56490.1 hypothetical protein [Arthrobacter mobilis]